MREWIAREVRGDYPWLLLIICIGVGLRIAALALFGHVPESDELAYKTMGLSIAEGVRITDGMGNHAMYNVGYPLFILAPAFFFFGDNLFAVRLLNVFLGAVAVFLSYLVAKEAGAGKLGRLAAAAIWALYLPSCVYGVYLLKENLMIPLVLGVIWCALRLARQPSGWNALGCGLLFGLLALTGNAALSLVLVAALALAFTPMAMHRRMILAVLMLCGALMISAPWMIRNMHVIGSPVLNTNGGFNLYLGNNPAATGMFVSISQTPRGSTWKALRDKGEVQASEILKQEAVDWIKNNPADFVGLTLKKAMYFWMPPFHKGKGEESSAAKLARVVWAVQFVALVVLALGSLKVRMPGNRELALFWLAIGSYTAVHMLFYVIFRYREPIMPVLGVLAALTLESLVLGKRAGKEYSSTRQ